jgi:hypothetical protein
MVLSSPPGLSGVPLIRSALNPESPAAVQSKLYVAFTVLSLTVNGSLLTGPAWETVTGRPGSVLGLVVGLALVVGVGVVDSVGLAPSLADSVGLADLTGVGVPPPLGAVGMPDRLGGVP